MPRVLIAVLALLITCLTGHAQVIQLSATGQQPFVVDEGGRRLALYEGSYALLVSQRSYLGPARNGWRPLDSTVREMDRVAATLQRHGFTVWRATDLTGSQLISAFRTFMARYGRGANNRLLFFFSGHGYTDSANDMSYLVPVDATDPNINPEAFFNTALPIESIQTWAKELTARHVMYVFDSCFSGSIFLTRAGATVPDQRGSSASERLSFFRGSSARPVRQFIAAGGAKEELPANSDFAPLFIEAIDGRAGRAADGYVTGKEIGMWLEQNVPRYRAQQNPHSGIIRVPSLSFGDMVFQPPPLAPPEPPPGPVAQPGPLMPGPAPAPPARLPPPPAPVMEKVTFAADAFFPSGSSAVPPMAEAKLQDLFDKARGIGLEVIIAVGHTDALEAGSDGGRQKLSIARAEAVKARMVEAGVERNRIYTEGKGAMQPVADNRTAEGRAKNRRVEVEVVGTRERTAR